MFKSDRDGSRGSKKTLSPKTIYCPSLEFFKKFRSAGGHLNFAKAMVLKVWIQQ